VRQKPHNRSFFDFIIREVHKVTKVRRDDPKNKLKLPEAIYNPIKYSGKPLGQGGHPS
jgi:hypothetical protein